MSCRYLCEKYDSSHRLLPTDPSKHVAALRWLHAAEATFILHSIGILYVRWFGGGHEEAQAQIEEGMSKNVGKDMDFLEKELEKGGTKFLVGDEVTVADIMMHFGVAFTIARGLGTKGRTWKRVEEWIARCEDTDSYKRAVKKTGHKL